MSFEEVAVTAGEVRINTIMAEQLGEHSWMFSIDTATKYPEVLTYGVDELLLKAGTHSLKTDLDRGGKPTVIEFPGIPDNAKTIVGHPGRYTIQVMFYVPTGAPTLVYLEAEEVIP